jgi:hypothetical protein
MSKYLLYICRQHLRYYMVIKYVAPFQLNPFMKVKAFFFIVSRITAFSNMSPRQTI